MTKKLDRNQTGFVPNMATQVNISLLIEEIKKSKK